MGIGAVAPTQFGGGQAFTADPRPMVKKREEEERHRQPQDTYLSEEEHEEDQDTDAGEQAPGEADGEVSSPIEPEPLTASLRGPEQHVGLLIDLRL